MVVTSRGVSSRRGAARAGGSRPSARARSVHRRQRDAGVQRLSRHFLWSEFSDDRRLFHQEFVFDVLLFAVGRGFSWPDVVRAAELAKGLFPQMDGQQTQQPTICFPNLTSVHQHDFTRLLTDGCFRRSRLFQAVAGGAKTSTVQIQLQVDLPPTPCPLNKGTDMEQWDTQTEQAAELISAWQQKEEELRRLRENPQGAVGRVQAAVGASLGQVAASLQQEAFLLTDILQIKLQLAAPATRGQHSPSPTQPAAKAKTKAKGGLKESVKAA
ncbi:unnamed protein product [Menidia menidia]|uniref:(Atlantic silverside) hypothetical protein n=1 Tax=Menidia menidia TaxID=238744 RepID=A0A8S4B5M8_9TELE|nr:unnamed protein product [Menidia menidia]